MVAVMIAAFTVIAPYLAIVFVCGMVLTILVSTNKEE